MHRSGIQLDPDMKLISGDSRTEYDIETYQCVVEEHDELNRNTLLTCCNFSTVFRAASIKKIKLFEMVENAGSEVNYRCTK